LVRAQEGEQQSRLNCRLFLFYHLLKRTYYLTLIVIRPKKEWMLGHILSASYFYQTNLPKDLGEIQKSIAYRR